MSEPAIQKPTPGQKTERQFSLTGGYGFLGGNFLSAGFSIECDIVGGDVNNIWPGWNSLLWGTYGTYRTMMRHATIAYVVQQVAASLLGSDWDVDADDDAPLEAKDWITDNIIKRRPTIISHALRAVFLRNAPFEVVPSADGQWNIQAFVPLLQDITFVMREDNGRGPFAGLQNGQAKLTPAECLYILNDSDILGAEPGDDYGRSRLENIRDTAWKGWLDTARRLAELEDRASGVLPIIVVPAGFLRDENGNPVISPITGKAITFAEAANNLLPALCHPRSQGIVLETPALGEVDAASDPKQALKQLSTTVDSIDMKDKAASQAAMHAKLAYWDDMMGRGLYRGERTLFATKGASRADSEQHTQNAEPDDEAIDNMIARQINSQTITTYLTIKFGPDIMKKVRGIKPKPLIDKERGAANALINTMFTNTNLGPILLPILDVEKTFNTGRVAIVKGAQAIIAKALDDQNKAKAAAQQNQVNAMNGDPNQVPVNGKMNGKKQISQRVMKVAKRLTGDN